MIIPASKLSKECAEVYPNGIDPHREYPVSEDGIRFEGFTDGTIEVDKLLEVVDLKLDWYIPSLECVKFFMFIRLVLGEEPENNNPKAHYFFIDTILKHANVEPFYLARGIDMWSYSDESVALCSREFSKSVLITYLILYMADVGELERYGKINYGLYVSDSMRNNVKKMMLRLKGVFYESEYLQDKFEEVAFTQEEATLIRHPRTKRDRALFEEYVNRRGMKPEQVPGRMKRTFKVDGLGAATSSRGASNVLTRPQFVFCDDLIPNEVDASSVATLESIESTIESDIRGGLSGSGYFMVVIGTPYNKKDPVYRRVEEGLMIPIVFPRAKEMPTDDFDEKDFESVWPDRHNYKKCKMEYQNAKKASDGGNAYKMRKLQQEHYLVIAGAEDRLVRDDEIQWYDRDQLEKNLGGYNLYAVTDFTASNTKKGDLSGTAIFALSSNGDWFMLDLSLKHQGIEEQYEPLFEMAQRYHGMTTRTIEAGIEINGQQQLNLPIIKKLMREKNIYFTIARQIGKPYGSEGITRQGGGDKHQHFMRFHPMMQRKKIFLPEQLRDTPDMKELLAELRYVSYTSLNSKKDDGIDLMSMVALLEVVKPSASTSAHYDATRELNKYEYAGEETPSAGAGY